MHGLRLVAALVLCVMLVGVGTSQAKRKARALPPPPPDLPGRVNYLARQLYGLALDESEPVTSQIQKLVVDHLQEWLPRSLISASPLALDVRVRRELEDTFSQLRYPLFGQPAVFVEPWKGATLVGAGYTLGWSDYERVNVVALFDSRDGQVHLAAAVNFVPRTDLHYEFLPPSGAGDFRVIVYGARLGKSQPRLSAILYEFDGQSLRPLWQIQDAYDGRMDVGRERVVVRYLKEDEYVRETAHRRKPPRHEAIYKVTPQGLELEIEREIPF